MIRPVVDKAILTGLMECLIGSIRSSPDTASGSNMGGAPQRQSVGLSDRALVDDMKQHITFLEFIRDRAEGQPD